MDIFNRVVLIVSLMFYPLYGFADAKVATKIHRYVGQASYEANAYWIETPSGIVLIDALMLKSEARELVAVLKSVNKPLVAILLTHPHVDHFGGIKTVVDAFGGNVKVVATSATANAVTDVHTKALNSWAHALGDDFEQKAFVPNMVVASGESMELAGLHFEFWDLGRGEADNNSVIRLVEQQALFTGDATVAHGVFYVGEGQPDAAMAALTQLGAKFPADMRVYSGHYAAAKLDELVQQNKRQLRWVATHVQAVLLKEPLSSTNKILSKKLKSALINEVAAYYAEQGLADYGLPHAVLAQMNIDGFIAQYLATLKKLESQPQ